MTEKKNYDSDEEGKKSATTQSAAGVLQQQFISEKRGGAIQWGAAQQKPIPDIINPFRSEKKNVTFGSKLCGLA